MSPAISRVSQVTHTNNPLRATVMMRPSPRQASAGRPIVSSRSVRDSWLQERTLLRHVDSTSFGPLLLILTCGSNLRSSRGSHCWRPRSCGWCQAALRSKLSYGQMDVERPQIWRARKARLSNLPESMGKRGGGRNHSTGHTGRSSSGAIGRGDLPRRSSGTGGGHLDDADAEAFCRLYALLVLRIKGLAGRPKDRESNQEVNDATG